MASLPKRARINLEDENENCILLDELVVKIIQNVRAAEWSNLEIVSKQFQRCTRTAYRVLKSFELRTVFVAEFGKYVKKGNAKVFKQFFTMLIHRCPLLQKISGFDCLLSEVSSDHLNLLRGLTELNNVDFEDVTVNIDDLSRFLKKYPRMKSLKLNLGSIKANVNGNFDILGNFYGLTALTITCGEEYVSGSFLSTVNAQNLKALDFSECSFNGTYVSALLKRAVNLETLHLCDPATCTECHTVGFDLEVFQCLPNLPKLREFVFDIFHTCVPFAMDDATPTIKYNSSDILNVLVKCKSLREIYFGNMSNIEIINDSFLRGLIAECPHLKVLHCNLQHCRSEEIVSKVEYLGDLTRLCVESGNNNILNGLFSKLNKLTNLSQLELSDVNEAELMLLKPVKNLTNFTCRGGITEFVVRNWIEIGFLKKLTYLAISNSASVNVDVADGIVKSICENAPNLKNFNAFRGEFSDETLLAIAECCKYLRSLAIIVFRNEVTEKGLLKFLLNCCNLRYVVVDFRFYDVVSKNVLFQPFKHIVHCLGLNENNSE